MKKEIMQCLEKAVNSTTPGTIKKYLDGKHLLKCNLCYNIYMTVTKGRLPVQALRNRGGSEYGFAAQKRVMNEYQTD